MKRQTFVSHSSAIFLASAFETSVAGTFDEDAIVDDGWLAVVLRVDERTSGGCKCE